MTAAPRFVAGLMESGVAFVAADLPAVNRLTVHILAAVAEEEARLISARTKAALAAAGVPTLATDTHIVPVMVGDAEACKAASDRLLERHGIYIQPINYPTVPRGTERLRVTPTPLHSDAQVAALAGALVETWTALGLPLERPAAAAE